MTNEMAVKEWRKKAASAKAEREAQELKQRVRADKAWRLEHLGRSLYKVREEQIFPMLLDYQEERKGEYSFPTKKESMLEHTSSFLGSEAERLFEEARKLVEPSVEERSTREDLAIIESFVREDLEEVKYLAIRHLLSCEEQEGEDKRSASSKGARTAFFEGKANTWINGAQMQDAAIIWRNVGRFRHSEYSAARVQVGLTSFPDR